jgi:hypothetical protein
MGSSLSGILAILFMHRLENQVFLVNTHITSYARYIDDIFILTDNHDEAKFILDTFNAAHDCIRFEAEYPVVSNECHSLSLLDFTVNVNYKDGTHFFNFFKKKAKMPLFIHHKAAAPRAQKINSILNEYDRITKRCSNSKLSEQAIETFNNTLRNLKYDDKLINNLHNRHNRLSRNLSKFKNKDRKYFFKIPFYRENLNHKIKRIFSMEQLPIHLAQRSTTLRYLLHKQQNRVKESTCSLPRCKLKSDACHKCRVVYQLTCSGCQATYIGSTMREMHVRYNEHLSKINGAIWTHLNTCKKPFSCGILTHANSELSLRIRESFHIKQLRPTLNRRDELSFANSLIL